MLNSSLEKEFEGCELTPYLDIANVWTNGYGNTHNVIPNGPAITQDHADLDLLSNMQSSFDSVNNLVTVKITSNQINALVDFVYNLGSGSLAGSTLLKLLNQGNYEGAAEQFKYWNHANGVVVAGLTRRRSAEEAMFRDGMT
jgi:lysozyme